MDVAVIGEKYFVGLFRLMGIETLEADTEDLAADKAEDLIEKGNCKILFVTERLAARLKELRERLLSERRFYPIFVVIPDFEGPLGQRKKELEESINKSMGVKLKVGG